MTRKKRNTICTVAGPVKALAGRNIQLNEENVIMNIRDKNGSRFFEISNTVSDKSYPPIIIPMIIQRYFMIELRRVLNYCKKKKITSSNTENLTPGMVMNSSYKSPNSSRQYNFELIATEKCINIRITYAYFDMRSELFLNPDYLHNFMTEYRDLAAKHPSQDAFEDQNLNLEEYFKSGWPYFYRQNKSYNPMITLDVTKLYGYSEFQVFQKIPLKTLLKPAPQNVEFNEKNYGISITKGNETYVKILETSNVDTKKFSILLPLNDIDNFVAIIKKYHETYRKDPPPLETVPKIANPI